MIKIIGGKYKKVNLVVPDKNVRPTSSIKREAIFSVIESYAIKNSINLYKDNFALDIFAGSGSLGLEAISRGISKCVFYENNQEVINILEQNCKKICKNENFQIIKKDVVKHPLKKTSNNISLIFIDPPYGKYNILIILKNLINEKIIQKNTIIVVESSKNDSLEQLENLITFKKKSYGKTLIHFLKVLN